MAYILSYRKVSDEHTVYQLNLPEGATELCTLAGATYVAMPDGSTLPDDQPEQLELPEKVNLTPELSDAIKAASPQVALINRRVRERIADKYSVQDEIKMLRIGSGLEFEKYNQFVEQCREWGREQKRGLNL